jgi:signal transduction histidine kinase
LILENAIKYSPPSGRIYFETETKNGCIAITVKSIGPLISKEELRNIGTKGFRSENAKKHTSIGQGYGMYNLYRLVDLLNGSIHANASQNVIYEISKVPLANFEITIKLPLTPSV